MPKLERTRSEELIEEVSDKLSVASSFDPHDITQKILLFGTYLTGVELYDYQYAPAYRTVFSMVMNEAAIVTLLTARQCISKDSIIHTRDGELIPLHKYKDAWKTYDKAPTYRITTVFGHSVEGTKDHPIQTPNGDVKLGDLKVGDKIGCLVAWDKFPKHTNNKPLFDRADIDVLISSFNKPDLVKFLKMLYESNKFSFDTRQKAEYVREALNKLGIWGEIVHENISDYRVAFNDPKIEETLVNFVFENKPTSVHYDYVGADGELFAFAPIARIEYTGEKEVWDARFPDKDRFVVGGVDVHNCGKSEAVAFVTNATMVILPKLGEFIPELNFYTTHGCRVGLFAPQSEQLEMLYGKVKKGILSDHADRVLSDKDINTGITKVSKLTLTSGSFCSAQVASKNSKIEGNTLDLAVIDESQDVGEILAQKSIAPMLTSTSGTMWHCGTVGSKIDNFYNEIQRNIKESIRIKDARLKTHFQYDYKAVIEYRRKKYDQDGKKYHLLYEKFVNKEKERRGANAESFKMSYALEWSLERGMFLPPDKFDKHTNKKLGLSKEPDFTQYSYVAGIDWAKSFNATVITILEVERNLDVQETVEDYEEAKPNKRIAAWYELPGLDYEAQHYQILDIILKWGVEIVASDATGVGNAPTDRLSYSVPEDCFVIPFVFSTPSKSEMWQDLEMELEKKRLTIPAHPKVRESIEYQNFYIQVTGALKFYRGSYLVVNKPNEDAADDYLDSLGLANHAASQLDAIKDIEVIEEDNEFFEKYIAQRDLRRGASW